MMLRGIDAFTRILTPSMRIYLKDQEINFTKGTRKNYREMEETIRKRYASWTDDRGSLNYFTAQSIAPFISIATTQSGLKELDDLRRERIGWAEPDQIWKPCTLKTLLLSKIKEWDSLKCLSFESRSSV